jgi:gliding motility-associated-like protein
MKQTLGSFIFLFSLSLISLVSQGQTADFVASKYSGCNPLDITFTDKSTGTSSSTIYSWDFGDFKYASIASPGTTYITPGTYTVKLTVKNGPSGTPSTKTATITVYPSPTVSYNSTPLSGCPCTNVTFTNTTNPNAPGAYTSLWSFGDGDIATTNNTNHLYCTPGSYNIALKVTNSVGCVGTRIDTAKVIIQEKPVGSFYASKVNICKVPDSTQFFGSASKGKAPYAFSWNFGDGPTTSALANPTHTYTVSGMYTVTLVITDANGCKDTVTKVNYIKAVPMSSDFKVPLSICPSNTLVMFENTSVPTPISTKWTWSDGGGTTGMFGQRNFWKGGTYTITMIDSFGPGCIDTAVKNYTVYPKPKPNFSYSPIYPCPAPATINFTNKSATSDTFTWVFGDGSTSSTYSPSHTYLRDSVFTVFLIQKNAYGCSDTFRVRDTTKDFPGGYPNPFYDSSNSPVIIRVYDMKMTFNKTQLTTCIPSTVDFSIALGKTKYLPATPDTSKVPICSFVAPYTFPYWFCFKVNTFKDPYPDPYPDSSYLKVPMGKYPYPIATYTWNFGDGSPTSSAASPSHTYLTEGKHIVTCTVTTVNGCTYSDTTHVLAGFKPLADFSILKDSFCKSEKAEFLNLSTGAIDYEWSFGDGGKSRDTAKNVKHTYSRSGSMKVLLRAMRYECADSMEKDIFVNPPDANFDFKYSCDTPFKVRFLDRSYRAKTYSWSFGDGNTSTASNPIHIYADTGIYNVRLITTNDTFGCADTIINPVYLFNKKPDILANPVCTNDTIKLNILNGAYVSSFAWPSVVKLDTPKSTLRYIIYADTGRYSIKVRYKDLHGCDDSIVKTNYFIVARPKVKIVASPLIACYPITINFEDSSKNVMGIKNISRKWLWGDASTLTTTATTASKTYVSPGSYIVKLIVTDSLGCIDSTSLTVESRKPKANFAAELDTFSCIGRPIKFYNSASGVDISYLWDFGDGSTSTAADPTYAYKAVGTYNVKLVVTDKTGCKDSIIKIAFVKITKPTASFSLKDSVALCPPLFATMINSSLGAVAYKWDFDNGSTATSPTPTTPYIDSGVYNIRLIAFNRHGCPDTAYRKARVMGFNGAFKYNPIDGCSPLTVSFEADLINVDVMVWDFADGYTESALGNLKTTHTYATAGRYLPRLLLGDGKGCSTSSKGLDTIKVDDVMAKISTSPACEGTLITFNDSSYSYFSGYANSEWRFDDGSTSTLKNPTRLYPKAGTYSVRLITTNTNGCKDTLNSSIIIHGLPKIVAQDTVICLGDDAQLSAIGGISYSWLPDATLSCTACNTPITSSRVATRYFVTGTDKNGCSNKDTLSLGIKTKTTLILAKATDVCEKEPIQLMAAGAQKYIWTPEKYLNDAAIANPIATMDSSLTYRVIGIEGSCIPDTAFIKVTVHPLPIIDAGPDQKVLAGTTVQLTGSGTNVKDYSWTPSDVLSCNDCPNPTGKPTSTTVFTLIGKSDFGCSDTDNVRIVIFCDQSQLFLPNTFTPNGDGQNDYFYPQGTGVTKIKTFIVYNRWGQKVFERLGTDVNSREQGWDGTYAGEKLNSDTFVYTIEAACANGEIVFIKGDITLIR